MTQTSVTILTTRDENHERYIFPVLLVNVPDVWNVLKIVSKVFSIAYTVLYL